MATIRAPSNRRRNSSGSVDLLTACRVIATIVVPLLVVTMWLENGITSFPASPSDGVSATTITTSSGRGFNLTLPPKIIDAVSVRNHFQSHAGFNTIHPLIYFITPTYKRVTQMADLTRLSNTLALAQGIYWILIEDADMCSQIIRDLLDRSGLPYAHVAEKTLLSNLMGKGEDTVAKGVAQRNRALDVTASVGITGVVYFGDDDNAYDVRLFPGLRETTGVGVFGVGYAGGGTYERCVVDKITGKVSSFLSMWESGRAYPVDMGGLAFHTSMLRKEPKPRFSSEWDRGYLETKFVGLLVNSKEELQPLMNNCTSIYVWHVKTIYPYDGDPVSLEDRDPEFKKILPTV